MSKHPLLMTKMSRNQTVRPAHFSHVALVIAASLLGFSALRLQAQFDGPPDDFDGPPPFAFGPPGGGPGGRGGGPGGMEQQKMALVARFDQDGDKRLNAAERKAAREFLATQNEGGFGGRGRFRFGGRGGPFGRGGQGQAEPTPGPKLTPAEVKNFPDAPLYEPLTVRTFFLEFEDGDWEKELAEFKHTDVDVPAKLTVDGKVYSDVGVHFRGMSSFMMVGEGQKRSLNLSMDFAHKEQNLHGYRTLNLLNSHEDPTFLRSILSYQIAREYVPAPKANFVRVVINGESWGIYVNVEQFNKDFVKEWFGTTKGARWKVPGSPGGQGSLAYLGPDASSYKRIYQIKSKDTPKAWADLIRLCQVLDQTPTNQLESALSPLLDVDGALKFLAVQNALVNNDGYWVRTSDYAVYKEPDGRFHILLQDSNENFLRPEAGFGGPGRRGGPPGGFGRGGRFGRRGGGPGGGPGGGELAGRGGAQKTLELDPLIGANDPGKPLISKLLAVPAWRAKYLGYVREIADRWLDWNKLGPIAEQYQQLIAADVKTDTRKLDSTDAFLNGVAGGPPASENEGFGRFPGRAPISLKEFADQRRKYLLEYRPGNSGPSNRSAGQEAPARSADDSRAAL